jgi:hypothetical protein
MITGNMSTIKGKEGTMVSPTPSAVSGRSRIEEHQRGSFLGRQSRGQMNVGMCGHEMINTIATLSTMIKDCK